MFEQFGKGKCINCGFLGKRDCISSVSICYEATSVDRLEGQLTEYRMEPTQSGGMTNRALLRTLPWCFIGKAGFLVELEVEGARDIQPDKVRDIIRKDRKCEFWYPWTEGKPPKEHLEKLEMMQLEQNRREFEQRMEKERKEFDLKLFEISQKVQSDSAEIAKKAFSFNRLVTIFFIILAILTMLVALLQLAFPNGLPWLVKLFSH